MHIKNGFNDIVTSYLKQDKKASLKKLFSGKQNRLTIYLKYLMFNETGMWDSLPPTKLAILLPLVNTCSHFSFHMQFKGVFILETSFYGKALTHHQLNFRNFFKMKKYLAVPLFFLGDTRWR